MSDRFPTPDQADVKPGYRPDEESGVDPETEDEELDEVEEKSEDDDETGGES